MSNYGLKQSDLDTMLEKLGQFSSIENALIFGSRALGTHQKGSDIDLCIKGQGITQELLTELHYQLEEETNLPYFFDIVHYHSSMSSDLKEHIDKTGKLIYKKQSI